MTNVLTFHRPAALIGFGVRLARSHQILSFAQRETICLPRLVAEWRINGRSGRLECHWRSDDGEAGGQDASRRSRAGLSTALGCAGLRHFRRKAARSIGHAGHSPVEVS